MKVVVVSEKTKCYAKIFGVSDDHDNGWYYCDGFSAYPATPIALFFRPFQNKTCSSGLPA